MLGNHLVFLDSFQFMSSSLDNLIKNLPVEAFKYTKNEFEKEQLNLMKRKGVYPYDYMDSFDRFNETKLPSKHDFYSILNKNTFQMNNISMLKMSGTHSTLKQWEIIMICI